MKYKVFSALLLVSSSAFSQQGTLYGTVTVASSVPIFGRGAKSVLQGTVRACASGPLTVTIPDIYVHLGGIGAMNPADATIILNNSFSRTPAQTAIRDIAIAAAGVGALTIPGAAVKLSASVLGYLLFGTNFLTQEISPMLSANTANIQSLLANTLDSMGTQTLAAGQCMPTGTIFISAPSSRKSRNGTVYPVSAQFSFIPGTSPAIAAPVMLRHASISKPIMPDVPVAVEAKSEVVVPPSDLRDLPLNVRPVVATTLNLATRDSERVDALQKQVVMLQQQLAAMQSQLQQISTSLTAIE